MFSILGWWSWRWAELRERGYCYWSLVVLGVAYGVEKTIRIGQKMN